jgi:hypothetical protein
MRYIPIPEPQHPEDARGQRQTDQPPLSFVDYMLRFVLSDDRLSTSMVAMQAAINARDSLLDLPDDAAHWEIHDHDWAVLLPVVLEPMAPGGIKYAAPLLAHGNAYKHAETKKPKPEPKDPPRVEN